MRFCSGQVEQANPRFAPSTAEFAKEVRRVDEMQGIRARPRIERPHPYRSYNFEDRLEALRAKNAHREILKEDVSMDEARRAFKNKEYPEGCSFVCALGTIYGPDTKASNKREGQ